MVRHTRQLAVSMVLGTCPLLMGEARVQAPPAQTAPPNQNLQTSDVINGLIAALATQDEGQANLTIQSLAEIGPEAVPRLRECLRSPQWLVRARALEVLGRIGPEAKTQRLMSSVR
jgi:HEAT repeat protein